MYSVVNMGHGHPKILAAAIKAMEEGAVINLPFHSPYYGQLAKKLHEVGFLRSYSLSPEPKRY
jgi:ornithine--oxo-acid transaminase